MKKTKEKTKREEERTKEISGMGWKVVGETERIKEE